MTGYTINHNGVIRQEYVSPIKYDKNYIFSRYTNYPLSKAINFLRLGFIIGTIKEVPNSICDVGYGNGDFLNVCNGLIKSRYGIEVNGWELPEGCKKGNYSEYYDVFTFFDSLEHFTEIDFVNDLKCQYLAITVPSCNHPDDEDWFLNWKHRRYNEHIWHFNAITLEKQMHDYGFVQMFSASIEDTIRKSQDNPNTITSIFKKTSMKTEEVKLDKLTIGGCRHE